jgi:hypothetical protein
MAILRERQTWKRHPEGKRGRNDVTGRLSPAQRQHVRRALRALERRYGSQRALAEALRMKFKCLVAVICKAREPQAGHALRIAEHVSVPIDDVLAGRFPGPDACPTCGRCG